MRYVVNMLGLIQSCHVCCDSYSSSWWPSKCVGRKNSDPDYCLGQWLPPRLVRVWRRQWRNAHETNYWWETSLLRSLESVPCCNEDQCYVQAPSHWGTFVGSPQNFCAQKNLFFEHTIKTKILAPKMYFAPPNLEAGLLAKIEICLYNSPLLVVFFLSIFLSESEFSLFNM